LDFAFCDEVKETASVKKLGIPRFSFTGFLKSILNENLFASRFYPAWTLEVQVAGGKAGVVRVCGREYQDF